MLDLDKLKRKSTKIKVGGEMYELSPPCLDDMIMVADIESQTGAEQLIALKKFLGGCGLPSKASGKLDGDQIKALSDHLRDSSKKK